MDTQTKVLYSAFDPDVHNKTFIYYCEVLILESGEIVYAVPSHQERMINEYCNKHNVTRESLFESNDYDLFDKMMHDLHVIYVWYDHIETLEIPNERQMQAINLLVNKKCVSKNILNILENRIIMINDYGR